ncbi:MAG: type IX secretion system sortase PorU [Rubricoccaceae bacterium]|nr:type IX secretion system sortase PorU [Rubricoccaceae bacterium]
MTVPPRLRAWAAPALLGALALPLAAPAVAQQREAPPRRTAPQPEVRQPANRLPAADPVPALRPSRAAGAAEGFTEEPARRDPPRLRLIEQAEGRLVYEVRIAWRRPLADAVRQHGGDPMALVHAAVEGWMAVSEPVTLGAFAPPSVEILAAEYDEVPLGPRSPVERVPEDAQEGFAALAGPVAEVLAVGEERRRPVGTLMARLLQVDSEAGVVRRNRRLLIAVRTPVVPDGRFGGPGGVSPHVEVTRSVLAEGTWFKIPIRKEGVYRIDRAYLNALGVAAVDPSRLQVYHNGGGMLPAHNAAPRPADLVENPVWVTGGGDGSFDDGDALYFYAEGPNGWTWEADAADPDDSRWAHYINYFSDESFVFLRVDGSGGARVGGGAFPGWSDAARQSRFDGRVFDEVDRVNLPRNGGGSGLEWLGAEVTASRPSLTVLDTIPPGLQGGDVQWRARVAARARPAVRMALEIAGQEMASTSLGPYYFSPTSPLGEAAVLAFEHPVSGGRLALDVEMENAQGNATGWIDWVEAIYPRALSAHQGLLRFHTPGGEAGRFEFALGGFAGAPEVWDVTDLGAIRRLGVQAEGGRWLVQVEVADGDAPRELVAFERGSARIEAPASGTPVANQNLHGLNGHPEYVIVTPEAFRAAADDLAAYRRTRDGLATVVVDVEALFNEFSGGMMDMRAVRDYMKFLYDRAPSPDRLPRYLLLFGDGHYDYRGLTAAGEENNFVPVYETFESLDLIESYTSDDYFGLLGDDEGVWGYGSAGQSSDERVDVGIGRIPARTAEEAAAVVAKIKHYEDPATYGSWRSRYTFVADDAYPEPEQNGDLHIQNADVVAELVRSTYPNVDLEKVYLAAYPATVTAVGRRVPEAAADIQRILDEGTLVWNYSGHGGVTALTDEKVITNEDIERLDNFDRLTIFVTATCSFGRYDMIDRQSGAELLVLNPNGGSVGLFTTLRLVYTSTNPNSLNLGLNLRLTDELLRRDADGRPRRLGDVLRSTKSADIGAQGNSHKFGFLGDPAMRIGLPERPVAVTDVNGTPLDGGEGAVLRANELAEVRGQVNTQGGQLDTSFNGEVELVVFDAAREVELDREVYCCDTDGTFTIRTDLIYRGRATVRGGEFTVRFIVPRDVSYSGLSGRITAYVASDAGVDGVGATEAVTISPTAGPPLDDVAGPELRLFLNDSTFVDGGLVGPEPTLVVRLFDEHGINTVGSGVGHDLLVTFDDDPESAVDVSRFYEGDLDSYQSGTIRFPMPEQEPGPHTLRVTAWDVANNSSTAALAYTLDGGAALALRNVYNYPNPTSGPTRFIFEHNQPPGTLARVQLRIYSLAGRPVRTLEHEEPLTGGLVQIPFDGLDDDFDRLASGVYLYRVRVAVDRADGGTEVTEHIERLAVIR